ncbi:hypothetical protein ACE01N_18255 [Saccharicrinis sp. FJH2]|uniref:hypothetical protein n=1 Tax=Saccharicrinis sp. FJH65 TaxID=3344659 RepID=UPI0035F406A1
MKKSGLSLLLVIILLGLSACSDNNECCSTPAKQIFKFKDGKEYLVNNVYVLLDKNKENMVAYPGPKDVQMEYPAFDIYKGYYLEQPNYGINTAYTSISISDYINTPDNFTAEMLEAAIIEKDPYEEYYLDETGYLLNLCPECAEKDTLWSALDSLKFHNLVDNNELEIYLKRVR